MKLHNFCKRIKRLLQNEIFRIEVIILSVSLIVCFPITYVLGLSFLGGVMGILFVTILRWILSYL